MNKSDISEIRKQFTPDSCTIDRICGCYVDNEKQKRCVAKDAFLSLPEEEMYKYFDILKKTLGGTLGKNLMNLEFPLAEEMGGGKHELLMKLRDTALDDDAVVDAFYDRVIENYDTVEKYYIVLIHASYDIPGKTTDGLTMEDASENVFDYIVCSICPVKLSKAALGYDADENRISERVRDWIVSEPSHGFLFPAFEDRTANIHGMLYYSHKSEELMETFIDAMFGSEAPLSAGSQAETFNAIMTETLGEDCALEVVKSIHENIGAMISDNKDDPEPLMLTKPDVRKLFEASGVENEKMADFDWKYDKAVKEKLPEASDAEKAEIMVSNIEGVKKFNIETPDVVIKVNPDRTDLIETRMIDGRECLVITVNDHVEVNGMNVRTMNTAMNN